MSDIVERLRKDGFTLDGDVEDPLLMEAAYEIERLREACVDGKMREDRDALFVERDALSAQLAEATAAWHDRDTRLLAAEARLAEAEENLERETALLTEARQQNADLMAIIDKRDEALGFIPLDKGMDMQDELRETKARLAEAERIIRQLRDFYGTSDEIDAFLAPDSAEAVRCPATLGNAGQCVKEAGHDGQHSLVDVTRPDDRWSSDLGECK